MAAAEHVLPQQTQANLQTAILAVAQIHGLGQVPESVVGYLMDQMRDSLTDQQRLDPASVYSPEVLGQVAARVEEAYGLDRPANLHGPEHGRGKDLAVPEDAGSFFAQDAFGLTRQQRLFGGISNEEHMLRSGTALPMGAFRTSYADIDPRVWNPASGAAGLTQLNFPAEFSRAGLDLPTAQYLLGQGFTPVHLVHAGEDAKALGLNPKDRATVRDFAVLDQADPDGRPQRQVADKAYAEWIARNKDQINAMHAAIDEAPDDATRQRRRDALNQFMQTGHDQTGQSAVDDRLADVPLAPGVEPGGADDPVVAQQRNRKRIEQVNGVSAELRLESGNSAARDVSDSSIAIEAPEPSDLGGFFDAALPEDAPPQTPASPLSEAPSPDASAARTTPAEGPAATETAAAELPVEPTKPVAATVRPPVPSGPGGIGHA